jgi:hypothetical protein
MCTVKSPTEVMVCDTARDRVREVVMEQLGEAARFETVHGEGTLVTCLDPVRAAEFQQFVNRAVTDANRGEST